MVDNIGADNEDDNFFSRIEWVKPAHKFNYCGTDYSIDVVIYNREKTIWKVARLCENNLGATWDTTTETLNFQDYPYWLNPFDFV